MKITDFFDVNNKEHLKAYRHLSKTGAWPKGFIPPEVEFTQVWHMTLMHKMAESYLEIKLGEV